MTHRSHFFRLQIDPSCFDAHDDLWWFCGRCSCLLCCLDCSLRLTLFHIVHDHQEKVNVNSLANKVYELPSSWLSRKHLFALACKHIQVETYAIVFIRFMSVLSTIELPSNIEFLHQLHSFHELLGLRHRVIVSLIDLDSFVHDATLLREIICTMCLGNQKVTLCSRQHVR